MERDSQRGATSFSTLWFFNEFFLLFLQSTTFHVVAILYVNASFIVFMFRKYNIYLILLQHYLKTFIQITAACGFGFGYFFVFSGQFII